MDTVSRVSFASLDMHCSEADHNAVFSAPNYCDSTHNKGAFINIESDYKLQYKQFDAVPHPDIKPMAVSNGYDNLAIIITDTSA